MKENAKNLIFIFSIVLNFAFIGTAGYAWLSSRSAANTPPRDSPFLYQELNLTQDQLDRVIPIRDRFHAQMFEIGNSVKAKQLGLIDLLAAQNVDHGAVNSFQGEIQALQQKMQDTIIAHILEETKIFTAEQRGRFFRLMKERVEKSSQQCPPWMRPFEGKKTAE
jgi:Spy/CpxP family protein refolding chaperone